MCESAGSDRGEGPDTAEQLRAELTRLRAENRRLRAAEQQARKAQADLHALLENTDDFILFSDKEGKPIYFNRSYAAAIKGLLGIEMKAGFQPHSLLPEEDRALWDSLHRRVLAGEKFKTEYSFGEDDQQRHFEVAFNPIFDQEQVVGFSEYTREITDHKRIERQLQAAHTRAEKAYLQLVEGMLDGVAANEIIVDAQGTPCDFRILEANGAFERLTGLQRETTLGRTAREVFPEVEEHWIETFGRVALTGEPVRFEDYSKALDRHFEVSAFRPAPNQFACVFQDIGERKQLEQEQRRAERLESVGVLAGGIAHDFNNILTALMASIQLIRLDLDRDSKHHSLLEQAEQACERAGELTSQLLTFARGGQPVRVSQRLGDRLAEWTAFVLRGSNLRPRMEVAADLWPMEIDASQISQVIHNLVLNAAQATPEGGEVVVRAENVALGSSSHAGRGLEVAAAGRYVRVSVIDRGIGIPQKLLAKIFDPYFTTKQTGSGLGLPTCYSIVRQHEGAITVRSTLGEGTCFEVLLPASDEATATSSEHGRTPATCDGRVLLMDDDEQVRKVARALLERLGYEVELAHDGEQALQAYCAAREAGRPFAAVILDLTVPGGLGGRETISRLRQIDPQVRAIVSSGYSNDPVLANHGEYGFDGVVAKPYRIGVLAKTLQRVLDRD